MTEAEFKTALHDKLCEVVDLILHYHNPCKRSLNVCLLTDDVINSGLHCCAHRQRGGVCAFLKDGECNGECGNPNLNCKIWLCATAMHLNPVCTEDLRDIERISKRYGFSRRPYLGERYFGRGAEIAAMKEKGIEVSV